MDSLRQAPLSRRRIASTERKDDDDGELLLLVLLVLLLMLLERELICKYIININYDWLFCYLFVCLLVFAGAIECIGDMNK